jgi:hypothetical protein
MSAETPSKEEAIKRIEAIDESLSVHRQALLDAEPAKRSSWKNKIDTLLDMRLFNMFIRDAK